jgi:hypothetical protein
LVTAVWIGHVKSVFVELQRWCTLLRNNREAAALTLLRNNREAAATEF